jgi:hypothetical protein
MRCALIFVAAICAAQVSPPPNESRLAEVRDKMGEEIRGLPDYVCLETIERLRASRVSAKPNLIDKVELEVAHEGKKELYSWPGRNMFADSDLAKAMPDGLIGTGAYASQMIGVLFGVLTEFHFAGRENLVQRATLRWDFTQPKVESNWTVGAGERSARVGSAGSIWVDAETLLLVRLQAHATQFPARFPLKSAARTIDYARMRIGNRDVLLPGAAEDLVEEARGALNINRTRFGRCREYSATSTLTFEEHPELPVTPAPNTSLAALPSNVLVRLALDGRIRSTDAVIGAPVDAHLLSDVRHAGTVLAPKGTPVRGVLRMVKYANQSFIVMIEFIEIARPEGAVPFHARLKSIDERISGLQWLVPGEAGLMRPAHYGRADVLDEVSRKQQVKLDHVPGVAVLIIAGEKFDLPAGTPMTWITERDERKP